MQLDQMSVMRRGVMVPMLGDYNPVEHGVSISILGDWLECREKPKFRVNRVQSKTPSLPLTFGAVVHDVTAEAHKEIKIGKLKSLPSRKKVLSWCNHAEAQWKRQNPMASDVALQQLELSMGFAEAVLPIYFEIYEKSLFEWEWLNIEDWFEVAYPINVEGVDIEIPIKGKLDGLYSLGGLNYLFETKCKSRYNPAVLADTLELDLQVRIYMYCASVYYDIDMHGLTYNLIRRPNLRQGKKETFAQFIKRCIDAVKKEPDHYFHRVPVSFEAEQIDAIEKDLDGMLREFYLWSVGHAGDYKNPNACENKYGTCTYLPICSRGDWSMHSIREKRRAS